MVLLPQRLLLLRWLTIAWSIYGLIWISLEGELRQVLVMGVGAAIMGAGHSLARLGRKRPLPLITFIILSSLLGLLSGLLVSPLTVLFMALKTGLHTHGPEFTPQEVAWALQQAPLWGLFGLLAGLGIGLLLAARFPANGSR